MCRAPSRVVAVGAVDVLVVRSRTRRRLHRE
ncbi:hypothetical protein Ae505Ps2_2812 [Pseudonocardia sp. Ae505_Ps2]|nr:hypothetical protein Ae505Ps2_2812 [Pseudonocardia sp. Ae505_Ps2]